jgi:hypothetical protein
MPEECNGKQTTGLCREIKEVGQGGEREKKMTERRCRLIEYNKSEHYKIIRGKGNTYLTYGEN